MLGRNYRVETTTDLETFTPAGLPTANSVGCSYTNNTGLPGATIYRVTSPASP